MGLPMVNVLGVDIRGGYIQLRHRVPYTMFFFGLASVVQMDLNPRQNRDSIYQKVLVFIIVLMPTPMRIRIPTKVFNLLENQKNFFYIYWQRDRLYCIVKYVEFSIYCNFSEKSIGSLFIRLKLIQIQVHFFLGKHIVQRNFLTEHIVSLTAYIKHFCFNLNQLR